MVEIPEAPDLPRMRRACGARLRSAMAAQGVDALILLGNSHVAYATGASWPLIDSGMSHVDRPVAVVLAGDEWPHLYQPFRHGGTPGAELPDDHRHGPVYLEFDEGVAGFARDVAELVPATATVAVDELTGAMRRAQTTLFRAGPPRDAGPILTAAKVVKTPDELACLRRATQLTQDAMVHVQAALAPGIRQIDLSARFVRRAFELGATANLLEPIWQVMQESKDAVWTTHGDLALPLLTTERELATGDVLWTDVSISYAGYCSDFGRTWIVGAEPTPRQRAQFTRWREILDAVLSVTGPGTTTAALTKAATTANGGSRPWVPHFYLGHGLGTNAAEMPFIGTDLGEAFDEGQVLVPGMVVVLEPIAWEDGTGGYRSEEIVVITEEGYLPLTDYPYAPYGD
ncbi:MAG TPA: M24 family metallopeptidase [Rugosimonospora sp.]|nr:M24 family metallopeptidase [Rugosimonospora sp.]